MCVCVCVSHHAFGSIVCYFAVFRELFVWMRFWQEARNFAANIAWLSIPLEKTVDLAMCATEITMTSLDKVVYHLWLQKEPLKVKIPLVWPKGANVTVRLVSQTEAPAKGDFPILAGEMLVLAWYRTLALARQHLTGEDVEAFLSFGRTATVMVKCLPACHCLALTVCEQK